MIRNTIGILAMGAVFATVGFTRPALAQAVDKPAVTDSAKIQVPDVPLTPTKSAPGVDFRGLRMVQKPQEHAKVQVGPIEFEGRTLTGEAPWQPHQYPFQQWTPFFDRAHTDFSWSFYLHWKPQ
jgi:hypothetical protein